MRTVAVGITLSSAVLVACLAVYVGRHRRVAGGLPLTVVLAAGAIGYGAYAMELWSTGPARQAWGDVKYLGVVVVPPAFLAFNLAYTGRSRWLTRRLFAGLGVVPALVLVLLAVPATHRWVRHYPPGQLYATFGSARLGPIGDVFVGYSAVLVLIAAGVTIFTLTRISRLYRRQVTILGAALAVPWMLNLLFDFSVGPFARFDPTAEAFLLAGAILVWGVFRFRLADLAPLAMATVVEQMPEAVIVLDAYGRIVDLNPAGQALLSKSKAAAVGRPLTDLMRWPGHSFSPTKMTAEIVVTHGASARHYEATVSPLSAGPQPGGGHLVVLRDITERKAVHAHLERMAHHDLLTGLPNRILFDDRFQLALAAARRRHEPLAVAYLDLDGFKRINDIFGHDVGDRVLQECAQRLEGTLRGDDTVSRMGGDEFVVLLRQVDGVGGAVAAATKLLESLARPLTVPGERMLLTASIGVALWPDHGIDQRALLLAADAAMYLGKRGGGNQVMVAAGPGDGNAGQPTLGDELRHSIELHELHAFFQPVVTLAGDPVIMDAELRWQHPRHGLLAPADFQTAADHAGLQPPLRRLMLSEACRNTIDWDRRLGRHLAVSVRLTRRDLADSALIDEVRRVLAKDALDAQRLIVKFVDGQSRTERDALLPGLHGLKACRIRLALEDFGDGTTPSTRLLHLPLDQVNLDSRLVDEAAATPRARRVLGGLIDVAHDLDLLVMGRALEGTEQFRVLRDLSCDLILRRPDQEPLSPTAAIAWLRSA